MFFFHTTPEKFKNATRVFLERNTRAGKERDYQGIVDFEKLRSQNVFRRNWNENPVFLNSSSFMSVFEKLRVSVDGRPNRRNKAAFSDGLVRMEGLTVEIKLRFLTG